MICIRIISYMYSNITDNFKLIMDKFLQLLIIIISKIFVINCDSCIQHAQEKVIQLLFKINILFIFLINVHIIYAIYITYIFHIIILLYIYNYINTLLNLIF